MNGMRVAVFGAGRSGISSARALLASGAIPTLFDERPIDPMLAVELGASEISAVGEFNDNWNSSSTDLIVTSPGVSKFHPKLQAAVENDIPVISEIELAYRISKAPIVAITGTNGKSTTTLMTYMCLSHGGVRSVLCGNIYGSGYDEIPLTEAAMHSESDQVLVAEISSFQLEWIVEFRPISAVITNVSDDHLNRYKDFNDYKATKHRIFENMAEGDSAAWHCTDALTKPPSRSGMTTRTYGFDRGDAHIQDASLAMLGESIPIDALPFSERHNVLNAMAAILLSHGAGKEVPLDQLLEGLKSFKGLGHRMERVGCRDGIELINNSMCTNPAALRASIQSQSKPQHVLVGGVNKNMDFSTLRPFFERTPHHLYLYGQDAETINRQLGGKWPVFTTMPEAFDAAVRQARSGEIVMLAPGAASMDQFQDFRDRGEAFTKLAKEWLQCSSMD